MALRKIAFAVLACNLAGCVSYSERIAEARKAEQAQCGQLGLAFGTPAYASCYLILEQQRITVEHDTWAAVQAAGNSMQAQTYLWQQQRHPPTLVCSSWSSGPGTSTVCQ